jgi:hypothetical protein
MTKDEFERCLDVVANLLRTEAVACPFKNAKQFESRVREAVRDTIPDPAIEIDFEPHPQAFPDIAVGEYGVEVKFTVNDEWRTVANSVLETNRIESVKFVYIMFGKMGGEPDVQWGEYEKSVMHVRTSHVPRFEVQIGAPKSLFEIMGISYDEFRELEMHDKMRHIRDYARKRLKEGERLWWLEDAPGEDHSLPIEVRLFTELQDEDKVRLRAEAILLCPQIVKPSRAPHKYDDVALYMLTYHGVLCHQTRDMFSAGSVAIPGNKQRGGNYVARSLKIMESEIRKAAARMDSALFEEYWGEMVPPGGRIKEWLRRADTFARDWKPSDVLFLDE